MKISKQILLIFTVLLMGGCLIIGGCTSASQKPANEPVAPVPAPTDQQNTTNNQAQTPYPTDVSNRVSAEAAKVEGVNSATAIVSGNMIYIGLDLKADLDKNKSAAVEKNVTDRVKSIESNYTIAVTSDVDTVTRIKNVADGIAQGKPLSSFGQEIEDIVDRLKPTVTQ